MISKEQFSKLLKDTLKVFDGFKNKYVCPGSVFSRIYIETKRKCQKKNSSDKINHTKNALFFKNLFISLTELKNIH